jgi:hypothetical protein
MKALRAATLGAFSLEAQPQYLPGIEAIRAVTNFVTHFSVTLL